MLRCTNSIVGTRTKSLRRLLSAAPSLASSVEVTQSFASSVEVTQSSSSSPSRLQALRQQLANEDAGLDEFARPRSEIIIRKKAPPRSSKILPKPKWLRVQPADSDNYRELRKTVRELGLATGTDLLDYRFIQTGVIYIRPYQRIFILACFQIYDWMCTILNIASHIIFLVVVFFSFF